MTPEAKAKGATTKRMTALAGTRLPLPGQSRYHEAELRAQIAADIRPKDVEEAMWVRDIAACEATIDSIRAQIAAVRRSQMEAAYAALLTAERARDRQIEPWLAEMMAAEKFEREAPAPSRFSEEEWEGLRIYAAGGFEPRHKKSLLDHPLFCTLLTMAGGYHRAHLQELQSSLREETKERDRIMREIQRSRRWARQEDRAASEEKRRDEAFRIMKAKHQNDLRPAVSGGDQQIIGGVPALSANALTDQPIIDTAVRTIDASLLKPRVTRLGGDA